MQQKSHINKGLIIAAVLICFDAITHITRVNFYEWTTFAFAAIIIVGLVMSIYFYNKELNRNTSFGILFTHGFKTAAVIACVFFIYNLLAVYIFFPNFVQELFNNDISELKKHGTLDEKMLKENMEMALKITKYKHFALTLIGTLFLGIIGSVVGSVATQKKSTNN